MFGGRIFQYNALPFGERLSPSTFQRGNNTPINFLRSNGILITLYLDDRLVCEQKSKYENYHNMGNIEDLQDTALDTFLSLIIIVAGGGFINMEKSIFNPKFEEEFLGMKINSKICEISIPEDKWKRFQIALEEMINAKFTTLTKLEVLRGTCASFQIASKLMKLFIREMTIAIKQAYKFNKGKLHRLFKNYRIPINKHLKLELLEWKKIDLLEVKRCWLPPLSKGYKLMQLHTDSSLAQLGGVLYDGETRIGEYKRGFEEALVDYPIAEKEGLAIWFSLLHFSRFLRNKFIQLYVDNQAVCWAFKKEGSKSRVLNQIIIKILRKIKELGSEYEIIWIHTSLQIGDKPSREISLNEEYIPLPIFKEIERVAGFRCHVDCMADKFNTKCEKYIRWKNDLTPQPNAIGLDFLNTRPGKLKKLNLYIFPPKNCFTKVAAHLAKYFAKQSFILIFHKFHELPIGCEKLLALPTAKQITLTPFTSNVNPSETFKQAISFVPSEKKVTLQLHNGNKYKLLGTPNIRPKATCAIINRPNSQFKGKSFRPFKILKVQNNIK